MSFRRSNRGSRGRCQQRYGLSRNTSPNSFIIPCYVIFGSNSENQKNKFCKTVWAFWHFWHFSSPFRICKLQIPLATRETDPVSGHHIFNNLQAHRATIPFQNVPTARRSRSTPTPWIVGEYRNVFSSVETRKSSRRTFSAAYRRDCERWKPYSYFLAGAETGSVFRYLMVIIPLIDIRQPRPCLLPFGVPSCPPQDISTALDSVP